MIGVVLTVDDPETEETHTVHGDRLAFSGPRLRDVLVSEPFVHFDITFRSISNPSLHEFFGEAPGEQPSMPTPPPLQEHTPKPGSFNFLAQPRAHGKRNLRRNRDPDYAYFLMSRTEMSAPDYSGTGLDEIRR